MQWMSNSFNLLYLNLSCDSYFLHNLFHDCSQVTPKFCKQYAHVGKAINEALIAYRDDVASHSFPSAAFSPYKINQKEVESFLKQLESKGLSNAAEAASAAAKDSVNEE